MTGKVQLTLHATKLKNVAGAFKGTSDPFAIVTLLAADVQHKPVVLGKTEVIKNSLNPTWTKAFLFDYEFGKPLHINVGVYDEVRKKKNDKPMGSAMFEIGDILGARGNVKAKKLKRGGTLYARVEKAAAQPTGELALRFKGVKLKNVEGLFGKSDPFFELKRRVDGPGGSTWTTVFRSKHKQNDLNPIWEPCTIDLNRLCDGDLDRTVQIVVFDHEKSGKHQAMGSFETSVNGLLAAAGHAGGSDASEGFKLQHKKGKSYGKVVVTEARVLGGPSNGGGGSGATNRDFVIPPSTSSAPPAPVPVPYAAPPAAAAAPYSASVPPRPHQQRQRPSFVDYISGACELNMCVAIDFTGSNGDPRVPGTLHYVYPDGRLNDYEKAITAVGNIVAKYDSDQKFPVWGFGAKYSGVIRHCFQVGPSAEISGVGGIVEGYRSVFKTPITMSGPTVFTEVIQLAAAQATTQQDTASRTGGQAYTVLLILTDGSVTDVNATKEVIAAAAGAPLSIVIVGIGRADFSAMRYLDDFETRRGRERDIVQFVEFESHKDNKMSLTQATLEEIPDQLVDYFFSNGIMPSAMMRESRLDITADEHNEDCDIDLSVDINDDGDIVLNSFEGAYVDNSYEADARYSGLTVLPPPSAPGAPSAGTPFQSQPAYAPPQQFNPYAPSAPSY